jgi:cyclopropane-fatty-acyl-phospholipid synthase
MMNSPSTEASLKETLTTPLKPKSRAKWVANYAKRQILNRLQGLKMGQLRLVDGEEAHTFGREGGLQASITVHDPRFYGEIAFGGSIGAGEATCWAIGRRII